VSHYLYYASLLHFVRLEYKKATGTHAKKLDTNQQYPRWSGQEFASPVSIKYQVRFDKHHALHSG